MIIHCFGINGTITCIVTLFLAEYCGIGWVVDTLFLIFWFFLAIAWKFAGRHAGPPLPPRRPEEARSTYEGWSGINSGPARRTTGDHQCLNFVVQAISKQNQNTQKKVPTTQPKPQYSAKNNVTIHMIDTFMSLPSQILHV